ncbi:hypothetical protein Y1Q_0006847 [Alligator mississippiensis]|uniref:Uncharacterized protein n=1 Tax=Alligator mississippiensis TaxID=8496 RepID=A0A151M5U8_ALLMI|nr:hypothetical protein Y1Q_0006847 [Alligator mississippiensis]
MHGCRALAGNGMGPQVYLDISKEDMVNQNGKKHVNIPQKDDERGEKFPTAFVPRVQLCLYPVVVMSMALNIVLIGHFIVHICE